MSLINELKIKSNNADNVRQEVIGEIKEYFDEYLDGDGLENYLRKNIHKREIEERKVCLMVIFWEYHEACSETHFACGGKSWINPENKYGYSYKGVNLESVHKEICEYVAARLLKRMKDLGFNFLSQTTRNSRFGYYNTLYYFGW